jgi:hypothetical protein
VRQTPTIVPRDLAAPELAGHDLAARGHVADAERRLVLLGVPRQRPLRRQRRIDDDDVDAATDGVGASARTAVAAVNPVIPRPSVSRFVTRTTGPFTCLIASAAPCTRKIGIRLV